MSNCGHRIIKWDKERDFNLLGEFILYLSKYFNSIRFCKDKKNQKLKAHLLLGWRFLINKIYTYSFIKLLFVILIWPTFLIFRVGCSTLGALCKLTLWPLDNRSLSSGCNEICIMLSFINDKWCISNFTGGSDSVPAYIGRSSLARRPETISAKYRTFEV